MIHIEIDKDNYRITEEDIAYTVRAVLGLLPINTNVYIKED